MDDVHGDDNNSGIKWANAFKTLQRGIDAADSDPNIDQVCVAQGVYGPAQAGGSKIELKKDTHVHGGFLGFAGGSGASTDPDLPDGSFLQTQINGVINPLDKGPLVTARVPGAGNATLDGFLVQGGDFPDQNPNYTCSGFGAGLYVESPVDIRIENVTFRDNIAELGGGAVFVQGGALYDDGEIHAGIAFDRCTFYENEAPDGGAMYFGPDGAASGARISNCLYYDNQVVSPGGGFATNHGGAIYLAVESFVWSVNSLFHNNGADQGGAIYILPGSGEVATYDDFDNCTFSKNTAAGAGYGSGIHVATHGSSGGGDVRVRNSIAYGNTFGKDHYKGSGGVTLTVTESDYGTAVGITDGGGNFNQDPLFVDPAAGNFRLKTSPTVSPCIDAGNNTLVARDITDIDEDNNFAEDVPLDLDFVRRITDYSGAAGTGVDMGAYEVGN